MLENKSVKEENNGTRNDNVGKKAIMQLSRRRFCQLTGAAVAALAFGNLAGISPKSVSALFSQSDSLEKFVNQLRNPITGGIPLAVSDGTRTWGTKTATHYTIDIKQFTDYLHPNFIANGTQLYGFGQGTNFKHLGGIIVASKGTPVQITFRNNLPSRHILPVDTTIMGGDGAQNRADVHLHGGLVPWISDGSPHGWWAPDGSHGPSFINNAVLRPGETVPNNEAEYYYPNDQSARLMWYHDHTFGDTRINAYAGIASAYVITDDYETTLVNNSYLPGPLDPRTLYIIFQDKIFVSGTTGTTDPDWATVTGRPLQIGDLWYAHEYETTKWAQGPATSTPLPVPSAIPEFFGDTILVNGTVYPYVDVEPREYRLRVLNACNARFLNPRLFYAKSNISTDPLSKEPDLTRPGPAFTQIGTEGGFLPAPVTVNAPGTPQLLLAPGERADLIVNLTGAIPSGMTNEILILYADAPAPYPMGDPANDYNTAGTGPDTRTLLQIRLNALTGSTDTPISLPVAFAPTDPFKWTQTPGTPTPIPSGVSVRRLTLNEDFDAYGRLIQYLGTDVSVTPGKFGREYMSSPPSASPPTEIIPAGTIEVWEILNLTADTHPMHFHLVNVEVLSRQTFDSANYAGGAPNYLGSSPVAPEDNELGWKETVRMNPGEVTRVIMKFDLPSTLPFTIPDSPRLQTDYGINGAEYVWHCHILEHEEHDMMRPLVITQGQSGSIPEFPTIAIPVAGTIAALALAGKLKNENKDEDTDKE